jgi:hypothetical protein
MRGNDVSNLAFDGDPAAFFRDHGWLRLHRVIEPARAERLALAFDRLLSGQPVAARAPVHAAASRGQLRQLPSGCRYNPVLAAHLTETRLGRLVADLLETNRVRLLQDALILKPAGCRDRIEWHQDYTYTGFFDPPKAVSVRLSLTRSTVETGCMHVVSGSHRWGVVGPLRVFTGDRVEDALAALPADRQREVEEKALPLELEPGDVTIHHCLTFHGSFENRGALDRKTVVTHLFAGDCRFLPERLPDGAPTSHFAVDSEGHLVGEALPVVFER